MQGVVAFQFSSLEATHTFSGMLRDAHALRDPLPAHGFKTQQHHQHQHQNQHQGAQQAHQWAALQEMDKHTLQQKIEVSRLV